MAQLTPAPKFSATFVDDDGFTKPAVGYKLHSYLAGTTTPKDTYTSYTLGAANTNPVTLDARGEASVWLDGNYKLVLKDPGGSTIWTVDDVRDLASNQTLTNMTLAGTLTVTSTAVTWSGNPTHSGNHTWSGTQTFNGNVAIGNASTDTLAVAPNAVTWSNNPTHTGNHTWSGTQTFSGAATSAAAHTFSTVAPTCTFGATFGNTARADASTLDWYEEGTLTLGFNFGGGSTGMSVDTTGGTFTRIGNRIFFEAYFTLTTKGSSTGVANLTGMPYASGASSSTTFVCYASGMTGLTGAMLGNLAVGSTTIQFIQTAAGGVTSALSDTVFANGSVVKVHGSYRA